MKSGDRGRATQPGLGIAGLLLLAPVGDAEVAHGVDIVRVPAEHIPERGHRVVHTACPKVIGTFGHASGHGIPVEIGLEVPIRFVAPSRGGQGLAEFPMRRRLPGIEANRLLEEPNRVFVPALVCPHAAEILVEQGRFGCQADGLIQLGCGFVVASLFRQRPAKQREVLNAPGVHVQMVAADFLREQRSVRLHGGDGPPDAWFALGHQQATHGLSGA